MIRLLSKETIDKIAAGEVVERPENVVKELIDNAVDSGATSVSVEIRGGGASLIRVTDNGCGIAAPDIRNAFLRHATSKLSEASDLAHLKTMGFRGEALASIAGVSRVELITKRAEDLTGIRYIIEGGNELSLKEIGVPSGTTVIVRDLFFNVPVRHKFLKSIKVEGAYVRDMVEKAALSFTDISFSLISDGKQILHTAGNGKLKDCIYTIYGSETVKNLVPCGYEAGGFRISGYVAKPVLSRSKRDFEIYFVNGRFVKSRVIERAIETAYEGYLMQHRFPFMVLSINTEPERIDVNIHPKKTEIRFSDDEAVFDAVFDAVSRALGHREHVVEARLSGDGEKTAERPSVPHTEPFEPERAKKDTLPLLEMMMRELDDAGSHVSFISENEHSVKDECDTATEHASAKLRREEQTKAAEKSGFAEAAASAGTSYTESVNDAAFLSEEAKRYYRFIGQVFETFWIIEYRNDMYIIDQHAAHEKVNYERLMKKITGNMAASQNIIPVLLTLSSKEAVMLGESLDAFKEAGFEIEHAGENDYIVRAVPAGLPGISEKELLMDMIDALADERPSSGSKLLKEKVASMACKASVKGNMRVTEKEMRALIDELLTLSDPYNCPHGRPVIVRFSRYELDKMFKRIV